MSNDKLLLRNERKLKALELRESGLIYKDIGKLIGGVSAERARAIVVQAKNMLRNPAYVERN